MMTAGCCCVRNNKISLLPRSGCCMSKKTRSRFTSFEFITIKCAEMCVCNLGLHSFSLCSYLAQALGI
jgi:hypothetical protein